MDHSHTRNMIDADRLRRQNRNLSILNDIARGLNEAVDLTEALRTTLARVAELLGLSTGWVWLLNETDESPYLAATQNLPPALADNPGRMEGSCYCLDTFRAGDLEGAANVNVVTCSRLKRLLEGTAGLRYHASIPLYAHGRRLGVLNVASQDWRELSDDDLQLLHTVGDLLGIAVERARLFDASVQLGALEERNRLAREIHDTLAQGLTAVSLQLESADAMLESGAAPEQTRRAVRQALQLTRASLEEARRSVLDLRAAPLEGRGLARALSDLVDEFTARHGVKTTFVVTGAARPAPMRVEMGLYRIAQEGLNNIARHAQASSVSIELVALPGELRLIIEDDGQGFDPEPASKERYGLLGISERARLLGAEFRLETDIGAGTRLAVIVPVDHS